ncbi:hypothetical protein PSN45_004362 [Yamadazyma tenuis]|uniref:IMD domain-containing protein n=1 Tax=Candida tenuis (strain ATCC 10573 / BCRC 21748 / CBS 615 / JCM 9827 / NBRC 10315 / NRRL Y-1498 / VKM Y-70) TaxID=590646 RepID=G3B619_CANTC|nr:uncharacterized protein CANTEDRAFT_94121 [Yamadazyma tenuis ATCC 10573]EGV63358.1 hypothetical protein CANTEDRAFT_94121 [Yamadazyma tenuis ATCC 10573]WEJ96818.1 hypothetical protein PSN45_004362 [Yamadazyma tenuis]
MYNGQRDTLKPISKLRSNSSTGYQPHKQSESTSSIHPPEHLTEFYSFVSNKSNGSITPQHSPNVRDFQSSEFGSKRVTRQPSLNTFTSFTPSVMDLPNILTSKDFEASIQTYENTLKKAERFRRALLQVSEAASEFGEALENTINENPKVNNSKQVSDGLINAGSLQYIVGSNNQILSRLLEQNFQEPLKKELHRLKESYRSNHEYYQQEVKAKSRELRLKELENIRLSKLKTRNLSVYKNNLIHLTSQLDEIDRLKYDYYVDINTMIEEFNQNQLLIRTGSIIRAELELFEGIARKGWSGGGLDKLLEISPDLFAVDYEEETGTKDPDNGLGMESINEEEDTLDSTHGNNNGNQTLDIVRSDNEGVQPGASSPPASCDTDGVASQAEEDGSTETEPPSHSLSALTMDESFSLPKVNSGPLQKVDFSTENILEDVVD